jgi:hypothetical protein
LNAPAAVIDRLSFEFLVQGELLGQRLAQLRVVLDDKNLSRIRHQPDPAAAHITLSDAARVEWTRLCRTGGREVEHSQAKEQAADGSSGDRRPVSSRPAITGRIGVAMRGQKLRIYVHN